MTDASRPHMRIAAVRAFDIRGVVGRDLDAQDARLLGGAFAAAAADRGLSRIAVARDGRLSSPELEAALVEGLAAGGLDVTRLGIGPTPMLAYATQAHAFDGGVMVTASHNPPSHNGFKLFLGGERLSGEALMTLARRPPRRAGGGEVADGSVLASYVDHLAAAGRGALPALRVAWDVGNGAAGAAVRALTAALPGEHVVLHAEPDGRFPNHHPDPAVAANLADLQAAVVAHGCDLGLAFDGDGDRLGAVDATGAVIWADQLLLLLAADVLRDRPGAAVVGDVKCSDALFDGVRALGGRPTLAASGYVKVREALRREGALVGGELSGHVFYADLFGGGDDALYAAVRVLRALGRAGETLADFRARLPRYAATPELRIACADDRKAQVVEEVAARLAARGVAPVRVDGVRVSTADGWWLLRASNTEPCVTARCEARDEAALGRLVAELGRELARSGLPLDA